MMQFFDLLLKIAVGYVTYRFLDHTLGDREEKKRMNEEWKKKREEKRKKENKQKSY